MSAPLFTEDWATEWANQLNRSPSYREAARGWSGSICFRLKDRDSAQQQCIFLKLEDGECTTARLASTEDRASADFVLTARERVWEKILGGRSEPLLALMTGQIRFERGKLMDFTGHGKAAQELMRAAQRIA